MPPNGANGAPRGEVPSSTGRGEWRSTITFVLTFGSAIAMVVLWATSALEGKAAMADVRLLQNEVRQLETDRAVSRERDRWRDMMLCEIARRVGADCPAPPQP